MTSIPKKKQEFTTTTAGYVRLQGAKDTRRFPAANTHGRPFFHHAAWTKSRRVPSRKSRRVVQMRSEPEHIIKRNHKPTFPRSSSSSSSRRPGENNKKEIARPPPFATSSHPNRSTYSSIHESTLGITRSVIPLPRRIAQCPTRHLRPIISLSMLPTPPSVQSSISHSSYIVNDNHPPGPRPSQGYVTPREIENGSKRTNRTIDRLRTGFQHIWKGAI